MKTAHDKPATVTDALGHTAHYAYDARGRKTAEWGTGIQPAVYAYNDADRLVSLTTWRAPSETVATDPRERTDGDTTTWSYDRATGLPVRKTYADNTCEITSYDTLNRVSAITNARGQISTRGYGPKTGELTGVTFANADGSEASPAQSYVYNHLGQLVSVTDGSGTRRIAYNAFNEAVEETREGAWNATLAETHDACGRPAGYILQYNGSPVQTTAWAYDQAGRLQTVTLNELAKPFQYDYDTENGLLFRVSYPNPLTRQTSYEATRDLVAELTYKRPGSVNDPAKVAYAYDELGRPTERKDYFNTPEPGLTHAYAYNERGEITGESLSTGGNNIYTYDNIGNRTTSQEGAATHPTTYAANALNQYTGIQEGEPGDETAAPPFVPTYDGDGNQTLVKTSTGIWQVSYNAENRPVRFENAESNTSMTCIYDSMGRRYEKKVEENGIVTSRKLYLYRGYLPIAELDATDADASTPPMLRKTYLWDPSEPVATRVLAMTCFDEAGNYVEDLYYTHDALKNTTALFGILGGRRASYTYGAYGQTLSMDGNAYADNPFRYSSEYFDEELGMISYNFRHYNPQDGRWITRDPIGEEGGLNVYGFLGNMPNVFIDYLGSMEAQTSRQASRQRSAINKINRINKGKNQSISSKINKGSVSTGYRNTATSKGEAPSVVGAVIDTKRLLDDVAVMSTGVALVHYAQTSCPAARFKAGFQCLEGCCVLNVEVTIFVEEGTDIYYVRKVDKILETQFFPRKCNEVAFMEAPSRGMKQILHIKLSMNES